MEEMKKAQGELGEKIHRLQEIIRLAPSEITEYDDTITRQTISKIAVLDENYPKTTLIDGTEIIYYLHCLTGISWL